ncbi:hypothetical protein [Streptomyces sp. NPDC056056]
MSVECLTDEQAEAYGTFAEVPVALFNRAVTWPRKNRVLLPGVSVPVR